MHNSLRTLLHYISRGNVETKPGMHTVPEVL